MSMCWAPGWASAPQVAPLGGGRIEQFIVTPAGARRHVRVAGRECPRDLPERQVGGRSLAEAYCLLCQAKI